MLQQSTGARLPHSTLAGVSAFFPSVFSVGYGVFVSKVSRSPDSP